LTAEHKTPPRESVHEAAYAVLLTPSPETKCAGAQSLWEGWQAGRYRCEPTRPLAPPLTAPGQPQRPELLPPAQMPKRKVGTPEGTSQKATAGFAGCVANGGSRQKPPIWLWLRRLTRRFPIPPSTGGIGSGPVLRAQRSRHSLRAAPLVAVSATQRCSRQPPPSRRRSSRSRSCASSLRGRSPADVHEKP